MVQQPHVTVGIPVYNGERFLGEAIETVLGQTFRDLELVISDNGSTDRTRVICEQYAAHDKRVRYYRYEENRGAAWNFNNVFALARGTYFKFHCYDDLLEPAMVERCVEVLDREPEVVLCYPRARIIDGEGKTLKLWADGLETHATTPHERLHHYLYKRNKAHLESQLGVFRRAAWATTGGVGTIPYAETIYMAEMIMRGQFRELPEYTFIKRQHKAVSTSVYTDYNLGSFLDPRRKEKIALLHIERFFEFVKAVHRARLPLAESMRCYATLLPLIVSPANLALVAKDFRFAALKRLKGDQSLRRG